MKRRLLIEVVRVGPGDQVITGFRIRIAAAQHRTQAVVRNIVRTLQVVLVRLGHLPDFFGKRHLRQNSSRLLVVLRKTAGGSGADIFHQERRTEGGCAGCNEIAAGKIHSVRLSIILRDALRFARIAQLFRIQRPCYSDASRSNLCVCIVCFSRSCRAWRS